MFSVEDSVMKPVQSINWRRNLVFASFGVVMAGIVFSLVSPFIPQYLAELGVGRNLAVWSGFAFAINAFTYGIMAPIWGGLADRHGKRIMLIRSGFGIALTYVLMGLARRPLEFLAYRAVNGMLGGFIPSSLMLVATNTPAADLGFALGVIQTASSVGSIMGPLVGGVMASALGVRTAMFLGAGLLCIAAAASFYGTREEVTRREGGAGFLTGLRSTFSRADLPALFLVMLAAQMALMVVQPSLPIFVQSLAKRLDQRQVTLATGIVFSLTGVSTALGAPLLGRIKRLDYRWSLKLGLVAAAILGGFQGFTRDLYLLGIERFLFGFANAAIIVSGNVIIAQSAPEGARGQVFGVLNGVASLGSVLGPLLGGYVASGFGSAGPFFLSGLLFLAGLPLVGGGTGAPLFLFPKRAPKQDSHAQGD